MTPEQRQALAELVRAGEVEQARELCAAMGERLDLRAVYLRGADLFCADLSGADLIGADLFMAYLIGATGLEVTA